MDELDVREFLPVVIASYPGLTAAAHHQAAAAMTAVVLHAGYRDGRLICLAPEAGVYEMARPWIEGRKTLAAYLRLLEEGGFIRRVADPSDPMRGCLEVTIEVDGIDCDEDTPKLVVVA